jgi:hypothetical protein
MAASRWAAKAGGGAPGGVARPPGAMGVPAPAPGMPATNVYASASAADVHANPTAMRAAPGGGGVMDDGDDDFWGSAAPSASQQSRGDAGAARGGGPSHANDDDNFWDFKEQAKGSEQKKDPVGVRVCECVCAREPPPNLSKFNSLVLSAFDPFRARMGWRPSLCLRACVLELNGGVEMDRMAGKRRQEEGGQGRLQDAEQEPGYAVREVVSGMW